VVAVCLQDEIGRLEVESRAVNFLNISPTRTIRVPQLSSFPLGNFSFV